MQSFSAFGAFGFLIVWTTASVSSPRLATAQTAVENRQSEKTEYPKELVREKIAAIIQTAVRQAHIKTSDGLEVTTRPLMSRDDYAEVSKFGEAAIPVLSEYKSSKNSLEQEDAIRLLGQLKSDRALKALEEFALRSELPFARSTALQIVTSEFPPEKSVPILERAAKFDVDPRVRKAASQLLATVSPQPSK